MNAKINSTAIFGLNAVNITVEIDIDENSDSKSFMIVGLAHKTVKESKKRIATALKNIGVLLPSHPILVNLFPADLKKEGAMFDLPIAIGILKALNKITDPRRKLEHCIIVGELSLDSLVNPIKGSISIAFDCKKLKKDILILPIHNSHEAALIPNINVIGIKSLKEVSDFLNDEVQIKKTETRINTYINSNKKSDFDFDDIKGQEYAKRALQIAAAGGHNIIISGPPGAGKTMLAKRMLSILPDMNFEDIVETTKIYSIMGKLEDKHLVINRPFRSPHHSTSRAALIGGGISPQPGEISLANRGILFLDEITEFRRDSIEALREPLENRYVDISRMNQSVQYPTNFLLIGAYNPCPCGYYRDNSNKCSCSPSIIAHYKNKLSGPLLDRIDLQIGVKSIEYRDATAKYKSSNMSSAVVKAGVLKAIEIQKKRFNCNQKSNSIMNVKEIESYCTLTSEATEFMKRSFEKLNLSMRSYHKVLKIARTIADISQSDTISTNHVSEALMYKFESK